MGWFSQKQLVRGLTFGATQVIPGIDLAIEDGEFVVFVGPPGCGKSTPLRLVAGLEDTTSGTIEILYPYMTVRNDIAFPLNMADRSGDHRAEGMEAARVLDIADFRIRRESLCRNQGNVGGAYSLARYEGAIYFR